MKYYAVRNGRKNGIFLSWDECKEQVHGYKSAQYKSFNSKEEAIEYLAEVNKKADMPPDASFGKQSENVDNTIAVSDTVQEIKSANSKAQNVKKAKAHLMGEDFILPEISFPEGTMAAYVDGSYHKEGKIYGCGVVLLENGKTTTYKNAGFDEEMAAMRNVAGEIMGAIYAMQYAYEHGYRTLFLYYDYEGISKWPTGEWKANKTGTIYYKQQYECLKDHLKVHFQKVEAHTGVLYNELADQLAKEAVGI